MAVMDAQVRDALTQRMLEAVLRVFGSSVRAGILKGSALKGDFIPGYSDFDLHFFVDDAVMRDALTPKLEYAFAFQEAIGAIDPAEYSVYSYQVYFLSAENYPPDWAKPLPGTYITIFGQLPASLTEIDPQSYIEKAPKDLAAHMRYMQSLIGRMLDKPNTHLEPLARLSGTFIKPVPYAVATLLTKDPERIWKMPLSEVLPLVEPRAFPSRSVSAFFDLVQGWPLDPHGWRAMIRLAHTAAHEAWDWYTHSEVSRDPAALSKNERA